jgi:hypothetical protein
MKRGVIDKLCSELNRARDLSSGQSGYVFYANIRGDGRSKRSVYATLPGGGVVAVYNSLSPVKTAQNLRTRLKEFEVKVYKDNNGKNCVDEHTDR